MPEANWNSFCEAMTRNQVSWVLGQYTYPLTDFHFALFIFMFPQSNNTWHTVGVKNVCGMNIQITIILWGRAVLSSLHHHWNYISAASWKSSDPEKYCLASKFAFTQVFPNTSLHTLTAKRLFCRSHPRAVFVLSPHTWMGRLIKARRIERRYYLGHRDHIINSFLFYSWRSLG